jgi:hypothetical protein
VIEYEHPAGSEAPDLWRSGALSFPFDRKSEEIPKTI